MSAGYHRISLLSLLMVFLLAVGCASKKPGNSQDSFAGKNGNGLTLELNGDSDSNTAGALQTVYFAFDSSTLNATSKQVLDANAAYLKEMDDVEIQIEGHTDERGGIQYNLALGERRAKAVRDYLIALGVSSSRISVISLGKEKPVEFGHSERAWSKNRRANFVVTSK